MRGKWEEAHGTGDPITRKTGGAARITLVLSADLLLMH